MHCRYLSIHTEPHFEAIKYRPYITEVISTVIFIFINIFTVIIIIFSQFLPFLNFLLGYYRCRLLFTSVYVVCMRMRTLGGRNPQQDSSVCSTIACMIKMLTRNVNTISKGTCICRKDAYGWYAPTTLYKKKPEICNNNEKTFFANKRYIIYGPCMPVHRK